MSLDCCYSVLFHLQLKQLMPGLSGILKLLHFDHKTAIDQTVTEIAITICHSLNKLRNITTRVYKILSVRSRSNILGYEMNGKILQVLNSIGK